MKRRNSLLVVVSTLLSLKVMAACQWDPYHAFGVEKPTTLNISGTTLYVDANATTDAIIATLNSSMQARQISYINCVPGESYGKTALPPLQPTGTARYFTTNIAGLSVRPAWTNATGNFGYYPSFQTMPEKRFNYPVNSYFRLEFIKTAPRLKLKDPKGDIALNAGVILRNWITVDTASTYAQLLQIGDIRIVSIPSCSLDGPRTVDFGDVAASDLKRGVVRDLNFSLTCATDYGSYSATASLSAASPNSDGTIPAADSAGNSDRMKIQVTDSSNGKMPADGSLGETRLNVADSVPVNYRWKATLQEGNGTLPEDGKLTARAEILLVVN